MPIGAGGRAGRLLALFSAAGKSPIRLDSRGAEIIFFKVCGKDDACGP
jgi:hypothetical protein